MKLTFDRDLVEAAYLAMGPRRDPRREAIYEIEDPQAREATFAVHVIGWFRDAGMERRFRDAFEEWPLVVATCAEAAVRRVRNPADELAEFFRNDEGIGRVGVGVRSARIDDGSLQPFLRHEIHHVHDMLNPAFGYPGPVVTGGSAGDSLHRERYGLLWDITIDGRLCRRFPDASEFPSALARHRPLFDRSFGFLPSEVRAALFAELAGTDGPRHGRLWEIATDPRQLKSVAGHRLPGAACPICGFTTFEWADDGAQDGAAAAIWAEFPDWIQESGCCSRCAEVYAAVSGASVPATVLMPSREQRIAWGRMA